MANVTKKSCLRKNCWNLCGCSIGMVGEQEGCKHQHCLQRGKQNCSALFQNKESTFCEAATSFSRIIFVKSRVSQIKFLQKNFENEKNVMSFPLQHKGGFRTHKCRVENMFILMVKLDASRSSSKNVNHQSSF